MDNNQTAIKDWMKVIPEEERDTYLKAGFLNTLELGERAALLVIDVTLAFTGSQSLTLEEAIREVPTACGPAAWEAMPRISRLIELFRSKQLPVIYTRNDVNNQLFVGKATKSKRPVETNPKFNQIPEMVAPREGEWVLDKTRASGFFHTSLNAYLVKQKVDTVVVCGVSTSGCVRATTVDAFSNGYNTFVVDDCCFDRSYFSHCTNLFDMNAKYATVVSLHELESLL